MERALILYYFKASFFLLLMKLSLLLMKF